MSMVGIWVGLGVARLGACFVREIIVGFVTPVGIFSFFFLNHKRVRKEDEKEHTLPT